MASGIKHKKCPRCNSCMKYITKELWLFLYCDFCKQYYHRIAGGILNKVDNLEEYLKGLRSPTWTKIG